MGAFQGRDDAFDVGEFLESSERFIVGGVGVFHATGLLKKGVLGSDGGVVESGGDGMGEFDLAVRVGEQPGLRPLQDAEFSALESRRVALGDDPVAACFNADHADIFIAEERVEQPDRIRSATDAGNEHVWQAPFTLENLLSGFHTDHAVEIADDHRKRMRAERGADDVMRVLHTGDPIAHRLVHRFLERGLAGGDGADFRTHQPHAGDVERLPFHIHLAHVNDAFHPEAGAHRGGGDAVLAGSRFRDDAGFSEPFRQKDLAEGVVDLVGTGVEQVLALQVDFRAAEFFRPPLREIQRGGATDIIFQEIIELRLERGVGLGFLVGFGEILERGHQGLGDEHPSELSEVTLRVG